MNFEAIFREGDSEKIKQAMDDASSNDLVRFLREADPAFRYYDYARVCLEKKRHEAVAHPRWAFWLTVVAAVIAAGGAAVAALPVIKSWFE